MIPESNMHQLPTSVDPSSTVQPPSNTEVSSISPGSAQDDLLRFRLVDDDDSGDDDSNAEEQHAALRNDTSIEEVLERQPSSRVFNILTGLDVSSRQDVPTDDGANVSGNDDKTEDSNNVNVDPKLELLLHDLTLHPNHEYEDDDDRSNGGALPLDLDLNAATTNDPNLMFTDDELLEVLQHMDTTDTADDDEPFVNPFHDESDVPTQAHLIDNDQEMEGFASDDLAKSFNLMSPPPGIWGERSYRDNPNAHDATASPSSSSSSSPDLDLNFLNEQLEDDELPELDLVDLIQLQDNDDDRMDPTATTVDPNDYNMDQPLYFGVGELDRIFDDPMPDPTTDRPPDDSDQSERGIVLELLDQLGELTLDFKSSDGNHRYHVGNWNYDYQWTVATATASVATTSIATATTTKANVVSPPQATATASPASHDEDVDSYEVAAAKDESEDDEDHDSIPSMWYCQPCTPLEEQQRIQAELNAFWIDQATDSNVDEHLVRFSDLTLDPTNDDEGDEAHHASLPLQHRPNYPNLSTRSEALSAAQFLLQTFDAPLYAATTTPSSTPRDAPKTERLCLGHNERIMGLDVSQCHRFLATASQDGTIRIWNLNTNALLDTLQHTTQDYECLRVAWASTTWGHDRLNRIDDLVDAADTGKDDNTTHCEYGYLLASGGADGRVQLWSCADPSSRDKANGWKPISLLDHATYSHFVPTDATDKPQIYSLQFVDHWKALPLNVDEEQNSFLLTSSDDHVHLWELDDSMKKSKLSWNDDNATKGVRQVHTREVFSLRFGSMQSSGYGITICQVTGQGLPLLPVSQQQHVGNDDDDTSPPTTAPSTTDYAFGGDRNPHRLVYVFDASYCPINGLLGVALSDGSLRLLNGRGVCLSILHLPGVSTHLTSFGWDSTGTRLATSVATGQVITWTLEGDNHHTNVATPAIVDGAAPTLDETDRDAAPATSTSSSPGLGDCSMIRAICTSVLDGGHTRDRPVFGVSYCGMNDNLLLSWSSDGTLCVWDSFCQEEMDGPLSVLVSKPDYPIYAVCVTPQTLVIGGGGSEASFVGIPVYLYDFVVPQSEATTTNNVDERDDPTASTIGQVTQYRLDDIET